MMDKTNQYLLVLCLVAISVALTEAQYEDGRCKCLCLGVPMANGTVLDRKVYTGIFKDSLDCTCSKVVQPVPPGVTDICSRCECQWQTRNTTTIKVVVILIICIVAMLVLYMLFLLCLDPLMNRRPKTYMEQRNEEVNMDTNSVHAILPGQSSRPPTGVSKVVNRVKGEQEKWKGTVSEQRKNIYDRHTMLN